MEFKQQQLKFSTILIALLCNIQLLKPVQCQQNATSTGSQSSNNPLELLSNYLTQSSIISVDGDENHASSGPKMASLSSSMLKTYIRTNNMRAYHLDLHSYRPDARFVGDPSFIDSENPEHKSRCSRHLSQYENTLKSFREFDPILARNSPDNLRLADTYGRPEAGVLFGNQFWLGSYEHCLDIKIKNQQVVEGDDDLLVSQYCLGIAQFPNWNPLDSKTSLKIGLCLPETCTSSMLSDDVELLQRVETMMKYQFGSGQPYDKLKLRQVYCLPHKTSEIRKYSRSAIAFLTVIGLFVFTSLIATLIDYLNKRLPKQDTPTESKARTWRTIVIESFSISRNLDKFLYIRPDDPIDQDAEQTTFNRSTLLNSLSGLKCIGLIWIICAHTLLVTPIVEKNLIDLDKLTKTYLASVFLTAHLMVDTFFALSGIIASYFLFKSGIENFNTTGKWIVLTVHRYWRLTPIYIICYWFTKSVGFLVNEGPLWDYMTAEQSPRLNCANEPWSEALLHMSDFKSPKDHCVPFAWFIANGIKFWMVTPFFLVLIHKSIRRGYMTTFGVILANICLVFVLALKSNVDVKSVIEFRPESADNMLNNMGQVYTRPYSRIGAYLIGLLAGHLMYMIDTNKLEVKMSKNVKIIVWSIVSVTVIVLTFVLKIANSVELDEPAMVYVFSISSALIRPLWSLCSCWLVFALAHGQAKWLSNFLTANCWRVLVRLSFCAYLAQGEVIAQIFFSKSNSETFNYVDMINRPIVATVMTVIVSFLMVLLLEFPLVGIEELILPKRHKSTSQIVEQEKVRQSSEDTKIQGEKLKSA